MKKYSLKTKGGEVIRTIAAHNIENAIVLFAEMKKISQDELQIIYVIKEVS